MEKFRCRCGNKKFVLTEVITTSISMLVDFERESEPEFKTNQVQRQYTLTCTECGRVFMVNESEFVDVSVIDGEGILFDASSVVELLKEKGEEGKQNSNLLNG